MRPPTSPFWPPGVPHELEVPDRNLFSHLAASAARLPDKTAIEYYGRSISYRELHDAVLALAGYLSRRLNLRRGDRLLLLMQNCPQFFMAYFAALRCDAVVVAVNPMCTAEEVAYYAEDAGARIVITMQDQFPGVERLLESGRIEGCIVGAYADFAGRPADVPFLNVPPFVSAPRRALQGSGVHDFISALAADLAPGPMLTGGPDLAVLAYTSGTTGKPKGAMLTHRSLAHSIVQRAVWTAEHSEDVDLLVLPLSHLAAGAVMNLAVHAGRTVHMLARWDAGNAIALIEKRRITSLAMVAPMLVDFMAHPAQPTADLSSVRRLFCGATAIPPAVSDAIEARLKLRYIESYGMTESSGGTHVNPPQAPRRQCAGIPYINTEARVLDIGTGAELGPGESGEIVMHGPSLFEGYWKRPDATREAFVEIGGKRFLRSGDIGHYDEDGYFYVTDRLKRMINASGLKVWPAEIEAWLYDHPAVQETCVISARDPHRGETVKACVVLRPEARGTLTPEALIEWARGRMAAYKVPRLVEFVDSLPHTVSGKVLWRQLQEEQNARDARPAQ
mgnify:FL=1